MICEKYHVDTSQLTFWSCDPIDPTDSGTLFWAHIGCSCNKNDKIYLHAPYAVIERVGAFICRMNNDYATIMLVLNDL